MSTWALLEGLQGKADLDGNGVHHRVRAGRVYQPDRVVIRQADADGREPHGSEGGEFLFELQPAAARPHHQLRRWTTHAIQLTEQLAALQKQIAAKQDELLKLQQSIQSESTKLAMVKRSEGAARAGQAEGGCAPTTSTGKGQELYREKKYDEALAKFRAAVDLKPGDPVSAENNLGFLYDATGQYADALSYLQKTLAVDPKRKEAHENIADTLMKSWPAGRGEQHYQEFLTLHPTSSRAEEIKKVSAVGGRPSGSTIYRWQHADRGLARRSRRVWRDAKGLAAPEPSRLGKPVSGYGERSTFEVAHSRPARHALPRGGLQPHTATGLLRHPHTLRAAL